MYIYIHFGDNTMCSRLVHRCSVQLPQSLLTHLTFPRNSREQTWPRPKLGQHTGQSYINGDKVLTTDDEPTLSLEVDSCTNDHNSFFLNRKKNYECFLLVTVRARSLPTFHNKAIPINLTQKMSPLSTHLLLQLVPHLLMWKWHMHPTVRVTWELT